MNPIRVVCAILLKGHKVLCAKRSETMSLSGFWEFPGGKIEKGETETAALKREIQEELGVEIEIENRLNPSISILDTGRKIELIPYLCRWKSGEFQILEHELVSFLTLQEAKKLIWAPADIPIFDELVELLTQSSIDTKDI